MEGAAESGECRRKRGALGAEMGAFCGGRRGTEERKRVPMEGTVTCDL